MPAAPDSPGKTASEYRSNHCPMCLSPNSAQTAQCVKCGASQEWPDKESFLAFMMSTKHESVRVFMRGSIEFLVGFLAAVVLAVMFRRAYAARMFVVIVPWALLAITAMGIGGRRAYRASRRMMFH